MEGVLLCDFLGLDTLETETNQNGVVELATDHPTGYNPVLADLDVRCNHLPIIERCIR